MLLKGAMCRPDSEHFQRGLAGNCQLRMPTGTVCAVQTFARDGGIELDTGVAHFNRRI